MLNLTTEQINEYKINGAICLRDIFDAHWIEQVQQGIEAAIESPGPMGENYNPDGPAFYGDLDMWQRHQEFRAYIFDSPAGELSAKLMESQSATFFYDQMLVKEPGSESTTPWHQDQPYWAISGQQVSSIWMPLDPIRQEVCLEFIAGSHLWGKEFNPRHFSDQSPYGNTGLPPIPDIESSREEYNILSWDLEPGDCIVFQAMMIHGARGNCSSIHRRRVLSTRWAGDDARYLVRQGETAIPTFEVDLKSGERLSGDNFPMIWTSSEDLE